MKKVFLIVGLLVALVAMIALVHPEFTYHKTEEVAHVGPVRATVNEEKTVTVPAAVSILVLVAGIGLMVLGVRSRN